MRHVVGDRIFDAYWPDRLYNHDAEDPKGMKLVGTTDHGEVVELNRKAVESDLLIYVSLNLVPMSGGHKSVAVGLCGYKSLRAHHNPHVMRDCWSYMDPAASALATSVERMGRLAEKALNVFHIETTVNNRMFDRPLELFHKNEDDWTGAERAAFKGLAFTLSKLPQRGAPGDLPARPLPLRRHRRLRRRVRGRPRADARALASRSTSCPSTGRPTSWSRASRTSARTT